MNKSADAFLPSELDLSTIDIAPNIVALLASVEYAENAFKRSFKQPLNMKTDGKSVILILVDGLGWNLLQEFSGHARNLWKLAQGSTPAYTCAPSTTAAAISTVMTGRFPAETNMVGYSVFFQKTHFDLITMTDAPTNLSDWQPCPTIAELLATEHIPTYSVIPQKFANSGLTQAALRGSIWCFADSIRHRSSETLKGVGRPGLTYSYWSEVDHAGHQFGPGSSQWIAALEETDAEIGNILRHAQGRSQVIIVADHGMIYASRESQIDLASHSILAQHVKTLAGEPRAVHVHCEPGTKKMVRNTWSHELKDKAWIFDSSQQAEILGGTTKLAGDFIAFAKDRITIVDSRFESDSLIQMPGVHGSLTEDEILVPLLIQ